jgi:hypothetical protein
MEDGSVLREETAPASVNGKQRTTPFGKLRNSMLSTPLDDDDLIDDFIIYNETLASRPRSSERPVSSSEDYNVCHTGEPCSVQNINNIHD